MLEVYLAAGTAAQALEIKQTVMSSLRVSAPAIAVYGVDILPRSDSGKVRFTDLNPKNARWLA
jgi:hypothetical protein